ncbi:PLDc N-terminal domain-containing protein [Roseovarius sp. D0-M9]|uniref:PLDc N-terminal domain-containing protein n=1 Tax=Roseovarius sp. D0-M9 TaxID=3127117 RepID=UPI00301033BB
MVEVSGFGGLILLACTVWAIVSTLGARISSGRKAVWILVVLLLPLLGFLIWLLFGPRADRGTA